MEPIVQTWLALQCQTLPGVARGIVMLRSGDDPKAELVAWPANHVAKSFCPLALIIHN